MTRTTDVRPLFQRRHYQRIAEAFATAKHRPNDSATEALHDLQADLADLFARDNPCSERGRGFDRATFARACSGEANGHDFKREAHNG